MCSAWLRSTSRTRIVMSFTTCRNRRVRPQDLTRSRYGAKPSIRRKGLRQDEKDNECEHEDRIASFLRNSFLRDVCVRASATSHAAATDRAAFGCVPQPG